MYNNTLAEFLLLCFLYFLVPYQILLKKKEVTQPKNQAFLSFSLSNCNRIETIIPYFTLFMQ